MAAESWMLTDVIEILGWTLLHFVWQGLAMSVLLAGSLLLLRRASASSRYLVACAALVVLAVCPFVTGWWLASASKSPLVEPITTFDPPSRGWTVVDNGTGWVDDAGSGGDPGVLLVAPPPAVVQRPPVIQ